VDEQKLKIYCPDHRVFPEVLRSETLVCEQGHTLSYNFPYGDFWRYCCNCQTFSPLRYSNVAAFRNKEGLNLNHCQVCKREVDAWYLCDRCNVFTTQSGEEEGLSNEVSLSHHGLGGPSPKCPGCLLRTEAKVRAHDCDSLSRWGVVAFATPRTSCPLCRKTIPSAVNRPKDAEHNPENTHLTAAEAMPTSLPERPPAERSAYREAHMLTAVKRWVAEHWRGLVVGVLASLMATIFFEWVIKPWLHKRPFVTRIIANVYEVPEGESVEVWADTFPADIRLGGYLWEPKERIINNGQPRATLDTKTNERHTESYDINVNLIPFDNDNTPLPQPSPIKIRVVPIKQWNNPPKVVNSIHGDGDKQEVRAGDSFTLEALATDDDKEDRGKLYYNWRVENMAVRVEDNGKPRVRIVLPPDLARSSPVQLRVKLTVNDDREGRVDFDDATLTVEPKSRGQTRRPGPPKYIVVVRQTPGPPQGANANATPTPASAGLPAAPPPQQPAKQPPGGVAPPQSNAQPAKPQQEKEGTQEGAP
jgi:hypothetical protein